MSHRKLKNGVDAIDVCRAVRREIDKFQSLFEESPRVTDSLARVQLTEAQVLYELQSRPEEADTIMALRPEMGSGRCADRLGEQITHAMLLAVQCWVPRETEYSTT